MKNEWLRMATDGLPVPAGTGCAGLAELVSDERDGQGIGALVYPFVKDTPDLPDDIRLRLRESYENALLYKDLAVAVLRELGDRLESRGRIVLMQGLALYEYVYPEPWARPMSDIDLYLPDRNLVGVCAALGQLGFAPYRTYRKVWVRSGLMIDLHEDLFGADRIALRHGRLPAQETEFVPSRLVPGCLVPLPNAVAQQAAFHGLKHGFAKTKWSFDVCRLLRAGHMERLLKTDESYIADAVLEVLARNGLLADGESPVPARRLPRLRRALVRTALKRKERQGWGEIALALMHRKAGQALAHLAASLFPCRQILAEMYGKKSFPLLLLKRITALCRMVLR